MSTLTILVLLAAAAAVVLVVLYNRLVALRNRYQNAFAQIDVQLKRRYDLVPNLVETARAYLAHERGTLEAVTAARNQAAAAQQRAAGQPGDAAALAGLAQADATLSSSLGRLFAVAEAYPDLKSNATMMQLSEELTSTENRLAFARQAFNDTVTDYNTAIAQMPAALLAGPCGFGQAGLLQVIDSPAERAAVKVSF